MSQLNKGFLANTPTQGTAAYMTSYKGPIGFSPELPEEAHLVHVTLEIYDWHMVGSGSDLEIILQTG